MSTIECNSFLHGP